MSGSIRLILCGILSMRAASVLAFHPEDFSSDAALQCVVCNSSYYCTKGVRYNCPANSLAIAGFASTALECICDPGYELVWRGLPLTYDFYNPLFPAYMGNFPDPNLRLRLWKEYAASIGATENTDAMGARSGHPDGFGFTGVYRHQRNADNIWGYGFERARVWFSLPLSPYHTKVKVVYRAGGELFNLYIGGVWKQTCYDTNLKNPCVFESEYTPGQVLQINDESTYGSVFLGENLYFYFTNPNPTWSCDLGLAPHWYLNGKKYTCARNRGVEFSRGSTIEACVCLPGYYLPYWNSSTPCLPCPMGTYADRYNMSQCTPCPMNSWHNLTNQTNVSACVCHIGFSGTAATGCGVCKPGYATLGTITECWGCPPGTYTNNSNMSQCTPCPANSWSDNSLQTSVSVCLCNAGWAGIAATGCNECAVNFYAERNSLNCTPCPPGTATYEYPRALCHCHAGYEPAYQVTNGATRWYSYPSESNVVMLRGELDNPRGHPYNQNYLSYGWFACEACWCGGGPCAWTIIDLGKIDIVAGVTIQQSCDSSNKCKDVVTRLRAEYSLNPNSGFQFATSSYDRGLDFFPLNHFPTPHVNAFDKVHLLFEKPVWARYIRLNPMLSGNGGHNAFFRSGIILWPQYACSACASNSFKNYTGTRVVLPDKLLTECQKCPYLSSTSATGSVLCSCNPGSFPDTNSTTAGQCTGCGVGVYLSNGTCQECQDNTFASASNSQMCTACNDLSYVNSHPRLFCKCKMGTTTEIVELNPLDNMRTFSSLSFSEWSGMGYARSRLDSYWIHGQGGGTGGYYSGVGGWLKMNLGSNMRVIGVVVQAGGSGYGGGYCYSAQGWMTSYSVEYSYYENTGFVSVKNQATNDEMFYTKDIGDTPTCMAQYGCTEFCSARRSSGIFAAPIFAQYVKITIKGQFGNMALRAGVLIMSDNCIGCPANTFKDFDGLPTSGIGCSPCQPNSVSHSASVNQSQCNCSAGFFKNGSFTCPSCAGGYYSLTQDVPECTKCPEHTFTDPALHPWDKASDCRVCKLCNTSTNAAFTDHYDAARGGLGCGEASVEVCTACPAASSLFLPTTASQRNFGVRSCVCDKDFYGVVGTACTACPVGQVRPDFINADTTLVDCLCATGYEPEPNVTNLCRKCPIGTYKPEVGDHSCTVCPDTFTTEVTGNANFSACVCQPGRVFDGNQCGICPENTYKATYDLAIMCITCEQNSLGGAGGTGPLHCSCVPGAFPNVISKTAVPACQKCLPGQYREGFTSKAQSVNFTYMTLNPPMINRIHSCNVDMYCHSYDNKNSQLDSIGWVYLVPGAGGQFLQIDAGRSRTIAGVVTQGFTNFQVFHSQAEPSFTQLSVQNGVVNSVDPSKTIYMFSQFTKTRYIKMVDTGPRGGWSERIRAGLYVVDEWYQCLECQINFFNNASGSVGCEACAAGKVTDGRTGQVECVCDVGTEPGAEGDCVTCRAGRYKATSTDKYANRACVNCSSCGANQQVNTECNSTHDITCRACQANSWSSPGSKLLDPCFCNAGYELQGEICVACAVGKARQVNNDNSIVCETCVDGTFTSVSTTVSCGACSSICTEKICPAYNLVYDCKAYGNCNTLDGRTWCLDNYKTCLASFGAYTDATIINFGGLYNDGYYDYIAGQWRSPPAIIEFPLPAGYDYVTVLYQNPFVNEISLLINGVTVGTAPQYTTRTYSQSITKPTTVTLYEYNAFIGTQWVITLSKKCKYYVQNECNASRDVICQECQTCKKGFYANNTCGANYSNDRLDTQCVGCPENYFCPGTTTFQQPLLCSEQQCVANQQVATLCNTTHNITCKACQPNSWSYAGRTLLDPCFCNAGYELQGELCVACPVGKARQANYNNSIRCEVCGPGFANTSTQSTCHPCSEICEDVLVPPPRFFVLQECNASRDVICQNCQTCVPGFFANNTCGVSYGNDRLDTQCVPCPAGSYCPGGSEPPILCPDNGKSPAGSDDLKDCDCDPGYFRDLDGCSLCHFDYYCLGKQIQYAIACPPESRTARRGSTSRLDCHCHTGYFRDPPERLDSFNCSLCLPGDFCFNNSAYNCSDALMVSAPGSGFFDNCTCVSGYYNNGTVCEDCPINYYCEGGKRFSCPANEWTAYEGRSYECVCMPGFYRDQDVCVPCTDDYFCEGLDDSRQACPQHSTGRGASEIEHCLCNSGFEAIFSTNASEPHTCRACEHTGGTYKYKTGLGNRACSQCTECLPHLHSTWTQIACTPTADALCDYCSVCHNATEDSPRLLYTTQPCQQFFDTRCANCTVCDWDSEWEFMPCSESGDSECSRITRDRTCPVGFYAGGHTRTTDSRCLPCAVRNSPYEGEWLHHFTSAGRSYDDPYSCELTCRAFSRLANGTDPSFGCTTCETGNVLFKEFTQNLLACQFECLPGYAKRGEDCVLETFHADTQIYWNHSVNVTHVRREAMRNNSGRSAFQLTVSHTAHGNFAVVVGKSEPTCAGRAAVLLRREASAACCFSGLWRVSSTSQLGLPSTAREQCSRPDPPWSEQISDTQLVFEVPDTRIEEVANCSQFEDGLACDLYVSIVDTLLFHHFSVRVRLEVRRAAALSVVSTQTYVPLSGIRVEAQLAYVEPDGSPVFVVVSDMAPLPGAGATDVLLHSADLRLVQPPPEVKCERYGVLLGGDPPSLGNASAEAWTISAAPVRAITFMRAPAGTTFLRLFYTLRLREREEAIGTKNMMHVGVWRNLSNVRAVCELPPPSLSVESGEVLSCSGLGETAVAASTALLSPTETVRGELGGLTSFVARALHPHVRSVTVKSMLAAFVLPAAAAAVAGVEVTRMQLGELDFSDEFKTACQTTDLCYFRYVHAGGGMHFLASCDAAAQAAARAWLRTALGVVEDDGHVQALCRLAHRQSAREYAFLIALVNTRAYLPRAGIWHDLQNHSAPQSTSRIAALFEFV